MMPPMHDPLSLDTRDIEDQLDAALRHLQLAHPDWDFAYAEDIFWTALERKRNPLTVEQSIAHMRNLLEQKARRASHDTGYESPWKPL